MTTKFTKKILELSLFTFIITKFFMRALIIFYKIHSIEYKVH
jgi:uncharacterized membrane protein